MLAKKITSNTQTRKNIFRNNVNTNNNTPTIIIKHQSTNKLRIIIANSIKPNNSSIRIFHGILCVNKSN